MYRYELGYCSLSYTLFLKFEYRSFVSCKKRSTIIKYLKTKRENRLLNREKYKEYLFFCFEVV